MFVRRIKHNLNIYVKQSNKKILTLFGILYNIVIDTYTYNILVTHTRNKLKNNTNAYTNKICWPYLQRVINKRNCKFTCQRNICVHTAVVNTCTVSRSTFSRIQHNSTTTPSRIINRYQSNSSLRMS